MSVEKNKKAVEITAENIAQILVGNKNLEDFNERGNAKPDFVKDEVYQLHAVVGLPLSGQKNPDGTDKKYPAFEIHKDNAFVGYLSFTSAQARRFIDVRMSKANKPYAKFEVMNRFNAPDGVTFGAESLLTLVGKSVRCALLLKTNKQPKFGSELRVGMTAENSDIFETVPLVLLELV
jgi:hypothetical protein